MKQHETETWEFRSLRFIEEQMAARIPGIDLEEPWADESLRAAEAEFIKGFTHAGDMSSDVFEEYQMYLGEGLIRAFEGRWAHLSAELLGETGKAGRGIAYRRMEHVDVTDGMIGFALAERSGEWWASVFRSNRELMPD